MTRIVITRALPLALVLALAVLPACASSGQAQKGDGGTPAAEPAKKPAGIVKHRVYTREIRSLEEFRAYSEQVADERFTKMIVDLETDEIYYFDVNVYPVHTEFVFAEVYREPETPERLAEFLANYDEDKPEFLLLYLIHHMSQDMWTFAFWEGDRMRAKHVEHAYRLLKKSF